MLDDGELWTMNYEWFHRKIATWLWQRYIVRPHPEQTKFLENPIRKWFFHTRSMFNVHACIHPNYSGLIWSRDSHNEFLCINFGSFSEHSVSEVSFEVENTCAFNIQNHLINAMKRSRSSNFQHHHSSSYKIFS